MSKQFKQLKDFEYYLWTTEDGKCFAKIKATDEESEVDRKTFRYLRAVEKNMRRRIEKEMDKSSPTILSLDYLAYEEMEKGSWLADKTDYENLITTELMEEKFFELLTDKQREVYNHCIKNGNTAASFAKSQGITEKAVRDRILTIKNKFKKFLDDTSVLKK